VKAWITFPGFSPIDVIRFGTVSAFLRFSNPWRRLEQYTADKWLRKWYGGRVYETVWRPLLIGKFGPHYLNVNMAWMWARLKARTPRLGYFEGGFQHFVDKLAEACQELGGSVVLSTPITGIEPDEDGGIRLHSGKTEGFDRCLVTASPAAMLSLAPSLPESYASKLRGLKSMGAVVLVLALKHKLLNSTYWLNLPASSPRKREGKFPFLALVEHTNYIDRKRYGGDHIVYCGDYVAPDHAYLSMSEDEITELFSDALTKVNPEFRSDWIRKSWLFRASYAQPVPELNHSLRLPAVNTPVEGLYFASMSQIYPWDRGTNFAVQIGRKAARLMMQPPNSGASG